MRHLFILFIITFCNFSFANNADSLIHKQKVFQANIVKSANQSSADIISETVYSSYVNDNFLIFISKPINYNEYRSVGYPVVFYLDGNSTAKHTVIHDLTNQGVIPEVISVSIGYTGATQRDRDYTYAYSKFYHFLKEELIPHIELYYNTNIAYHTLFGHSYGGLFGFNIIFDLIDPTIFPFKNVISSSTSFGYPNFTDDYYCRKLESSYFYSNNKSLPINLYMTMGSDDATNYVPYFNNMTSTIKSRNYTDLNYKHVINEGKTHGTNQIISFTDGLIWVFSQAGDSVWQRPNGINDNLINKIEIFPNPSTGIFNINISNTLAKKAKVQIYDFSGKLVLLKELDEGIIDLTGYSKGIYVTKISLGDKVVVEKLVIK